MGFGSMQSRPFETQPINLLQQKAVSHSDYTYDLNRTGFRKYLFALN
jgi:hypothetical protein